MPSVPEDRAAAAKKALADRIAAQRAEVGRQDEAAEKAADEVSAQDRRPRLGPHRAEPGGRRGPGRPERLRPRGQAAPAGGGAAAGVGPPRHPVI
ncbi:hypothetical protein Arub01_19320 [Actinomadura rubrobrunea]|uniref:Uncharacterized protein n=1 Tax=Actinomadura rubrobrunea TaxID=115335 RepID=A0A9W6PVC2_9ACTN|nr:hypothetical protein [Actinomadura rubrobrunea]GLW63688.1 hypothetical protein Arub01_19320 [Actinomadura rubrobrunea]